MEIHENNYQIVYDFIVYFYLIIGLLYLGIEQRIPRNYIIIIIYFFFKMVTGYDKCTLSYIECKLRNVKKEDGYLYDFIKSITNSKNHNCYLIAILFIFVFFYQKFNLNT